MTVKLERIEYQHGMLDGRTKPESLSKKVWPTDALEFGERLVPVKAKP